MLDGYTLYLSLFFTGSRNPYDLRGAGAGFALCWKGHPQLLIGQPNEQNELVQVISDTMLITVPRYSPRLIVIRILC